MKKEGYFIINSNYRNRYGEIDIVAAKDNYLIFIEVKTRTNLKYGDPLESIGKTKISRIKRLASAYISDNRLSGSNICFDVITIIIGKNLAKKIFTEDNPLDTLIKLNTPEYKNCLDVKHIKNAF